MYLIAFLLLASIAFIMKVSSPSSLSSSSNLTASGGSSDLQVHLSATSSSIPTSDGAGIWD